MDDFNETASDKNKEVEELIVTEDIRSYIYETAKWAKFLSVVGFVVAGWLIMLAFSASAFETALNQTPGGAQFAAMGSTVLTIFCLLSALLYFYPSLMLFKYSTAAKNAVLFAEQESLVVAMSKMKSFFKFWGILTIAIIAFYALALILVIFAKMGMA
ncbi:DUF5362 family protein [Pedobacter frigoris]|uniref:DUF5362 domain-containing protein n=1 Tax=Pedobacter frigoris TaxID=2571272 RepID=A0A4U1CBH3_9SPHI|nr:DUF5362 family protein [Pedobacter frigoris]TKC03947.1 hypothetical protein FA047_18550 [Pedobacter frigoris]